MEELVALPTWQMDIGRRHASEPHAVQLRRILPVKRLRTKPSRAISLVSVDDSMVDVDDGRGNPPVPRSDAARPKGPCRQKQKLETDDRPTKQDTYTRVLAASSCHGEIDHCYALGCVFSKRAGGCACVEGRETACELVRLAVKGTDGPSLETKTSCV